MADDAEQAATVAAKFGLLSKKRGTLKGRLTRFQKYFNGLDLTKIDAMIIEQLNVRLEKFEPVWDEFNIIQSQIEELQEKIDDEERQYFEDSYFELVGKVKMTCNNFKFDESERSGLDNSSVASRHARSSKNNNFESAVKLPPIHIPTFNGSYENWLDFKEVFLSLVDKNNSLMDIQKLHYLRSSLNKDPLQLIKSVEISAKNYKVAWDLLVDRYENKKIIVYNHIRAIFEYPQVIKECHTDLRQLFDNVNKHLHALNAMGEETETWDRLIIYIVSNKFDCITKRDWESYQYNEELPTWNDMKNFLKNKCEILEKLEYSKIKPNRSSSQKASHSAAFSALEKPEILCYNCKEKHTITSCPKFLKLNVSDRISLIKRLKLCLNCFRPNHPFWKCRSQKCNKCKKPHHMLLHLENYSVVKNKSDSVKVSTATATNTDSKYENTRAHCSSGDTDLVRDEAVVESSESISSQAFSECGVANNYGKSQVLLSTAVVKLFDGKDFILCRALLDSGSQSNFISESLCKRLNITRHKINHVVKGVALALAKISEQINISIGSCYSDFNIKINCLVLPQITDKLPLIHFDKKVLNIPSNIQLADPNYNIPGEIQLLLGASVFWNIFCLGQERLGKDLPVLQNSEFGWIIAGPLNLNTNSQCNMSVSHLNIQEESSLDRHILRFWELEELNNKEVLLSRDEKFCENNFIKTTKRDETGRFVVEMPFKESVKDLGNSRDMALSRFQSLEKKLNKNLELKAEYSHFMKEYLDLSHMRKIGLDDDFNGSYLPHHAIIKSNSLTTKCRVVFDASAKSSSGLSLNDVQYCGPKLQQDIFSILLRFRRYAFVMTADVSKMYRQILISENHTKYLKIFWRQEPTDELDCYELKTVTYGTASAPYLAIRCLMELAIQNKSKFPIASNIISKDFYMDDLLTGADAAEDLVKIQNEVSYILSTAGFELRKWLCNNQDVLNAFRINTNLDVSVLHIGEDEPNKTLGVYWNSIKDSIQYVIDSDSTDRTVTKRIILSVICQIFDPLGLLAPIIIVGKLIIQELWKLKISWDHAVPTGLYNQWSSFIKELHIINKFNIPRQVCFSDNMTIELHGFSDSSQRAYGACLYVRCILSSGRILSNLLCAKSRVAPLKQVSLPRLELCAALLLANLAQKACTAVEIKFNRKYFWSDSMITLYWIKSEPTRWKTFVANRVSEIQGLTDVKDWYHVESSCNPADLLSRGMPPNILKNNNLWWSGPDWLVVENDKWNLSSIPDSLDAPEQKVASVGLTVVSNENIINKLLYKFSSLHRLLRVLAYIYRFIKNVKCLKGQRNYGTLNPIELDNALNLLVAEVQKECFSKEYNCLSNGKTLKKNSKILPLNPFLQDDLIRVGGRLKNSSFNFDKKHPILLPRSHHLTELILRQEHNRLLHCGSQMLLCSVRERFWPICGRNACKKIVKNCITCFKAKPSNSNYLMGNLPEVRTNVYLPFLNVGVDYGGPFYIKDRKIRGAKITKAYICLFVCMCTKAVHLELVSSLSADSFLATLKRFVSRRGKPANIYSDNGLNFVGTNNELLRIYEFLKTNSEYITEKLALERISWHFIPARAPSFGGIWEAGIKSVKHHLKRVLGENAYTYEDVSTILCQVEAILNSRPLAPLSSDPEDLTALTPAHFMIGRSYTALPEYNIMDIPQNRLKFYQQLQSIIQHFWARWQKEYICELQVRNKWKENSRNILKLGSLVLMKCENAATLNWLLGRIVGLFPGSDNVIRVVDIKTASGVFRRSVNSVCSLPIDQD